MDRSSNDTLAGRSSGLRDQRGKNGLR